MASMVIAIAFSIVALPCMERLGKYMAIWSLFIWFAGVLCMAGFSIGLKVIYVGRNALGSSGPEYESAKLSECPATVTNGAYCYQDGFIGRYNTMLAFGFLGAFMLAWQGVNVWKMRIKYLSAEDLGEKNELLEDYTDYSKDASSPKSPGSKKKEKEKEEGGGVPGDPPPLCV